MRFLITGAAGFLGHHCVDFLLRFTDHTIVSLDRLDTSGNLNRLTDLDCWETEKRRVKIIHHDLKAAINEQLAKQIGPVDNVIHIGAATHVDRSIQDPVGFVLDNVLGTCHILEYARKLENLQVYYQQSTDEVYGHAPPGVFYKEWDRHRPGNPYSATKSGADSLCLAYQNTYRIPIILGTAMNIIGERQLSEKYLPLIIRSVLHDEEISIHADSTCTIPGMRTYLHARNVCSAILFLLDHGEYGERYNIVGDCEIDNLSLAQMVADIIGRPLKYKLVSWHASRPGHELRYGLDGSRMREMGWKPPVSFTESLEKTVHWYLNNEHWL